MKTVKFDEGKKFETSFDFDDDEVIIFGPVENNTVRFNADMLQSCLTILTLGIILIFKPAKTWKATFVLTNKRLVSIPLPPNKKNWPAESFYYKDILKANVVKPTDEKMGEKTNATFGLIMKSGVKLPVSGDPQFTIWAKMNAKYWANAAKMLANQVGTGMANQFNEAAAMSQTYQNKLEAEAKGDRYYQVVNAAKIKLENMGSSDAGHVEIRNFFIELINECVKIVNG
jgi:hypothetical protein